jgi:transcriptional regulator with GAF, ATPase, and Fis domain
VAAVPPRSSYQAIIGASPAMQDLYSLLDRIARSESTILIQGENGTGKELVARAIHTSSPRTDRAFVVTNCSAFNDNLLDSELFGHKRGAFTGASSDKPGLFEVADNGTFFLDEIGDMSAALQVKVLRVLQEGTFNRVGDTETRKVDVRIVAATNRDLKGMVERGQFREDLYYRINVINLVLPALRQRREDLAILVDHFLHKHRRAGGGTPKRLSVACLARLEQYTWPGNVRELENEIEDRAARRARRRRSDHRRGPPVRADPPPPGDARHHGGDAVAARGRRGARAPDDRRGAAPPPREQDARLGGAQGVAAQPDPPVPEVQPGGVSAWKR